MLLLPSASPRAADAAAPRCTHRASGGDRGATVSRGGEEAGRACNALGHRQRPQAAQRRAARRSQPLARQRRRWKVVRAHRVEGREGRGRLGCQVSTSQQRASATRYGQRVAGDVSPVYRESSEGPHAPLGPAPSSFAAALRAALHAFLCAGQPATWCSRQQ